MLHKFILLLAMNIGLSISLVWSQTLEDRIKASYSPLAPYTPTGILLDRSPLKYLMVDSLAPDRYHPGSSLLGTQFRFESLYNLFYHASFTGSPFLNHPSQIPEFIDSLRLGYDENTASWPNVANMPTHCDVVMGSLFLNYNTIHSDALDEDWIRYSAIDDKYYLQLHPYQITDTLWITGDPGIGSYIIHTVTIYPDSVESLNQWKTSDDLFIIASLTPEVTVPFNAPIRFFFPTSLNLSNSNNVLLEVDFNDGNGYVLVTPGLLKHITYIESGVKTIRARIKNFNGLVIGDLPSTTYVRVEKARFEPDIIFTSGNLSDCNIDLSDGIGEAMLSFKYSPASNGKLVNPFILVEGFESSEYSKIDAELDNKVGSGFGKINWASFSSGVDITEYPQMQLLPVVLDSLLALGYDVGFVDYRTNRARIEKNANALISLLQQVQERLVLNNSLNGIQLMGASMGGLIARLAIVRMEKNNCCHSVKIYYSFSTPHQGANLPIAAQHLTYDLGYKFNFLNFLDRSKFSYTQVLNSPAARQLLIVHREPSAHAEHLAFYQYLDQQGYPVLAKNIGITDGSLNGFLHRLDNTNINSPVLGELQSLFEFNFKVKAPSKVRTVFDFPAANFILASANGGSIEHSPTVTSPNWIYRHGRDIYSNMFDYLELWILFGRSKSELKLVKLFHNQAMIQFPQYVIPLSVSKLLLINFCILKNEHFMSQRIQNNRLSNLLYAFEYLNHAVEGLDNAPADFTDIVRKIVKPFDQFKLGFAFDNVFPTSSFVSSVSALDENRSTRDILINQNQNLTHFDYIWAKLELGKNEYFNNAHVYVSENFISWLISSLHSINDTSKNLGLELKVENFNFGKAQNGLLQQTNYYFYHETFPSVRIASNYRLQFNRMLPLGYANISNPLLPEVNSNFASYSRNFNCQPVQVINEGIIELGEPSSTPFINTAHVQFRSGSVLELFSNSVLNIHQGSRLTIDSGATLIIHPNATVYLEGSNSILEIKGRVVFLPNATLELTGGGYLMVDQDSNQVTNIFDLWEAQGPAEIKFQGQQSAQRLMELKSVLRLSPRIKLDFKTGRVLMHTSVLLDLFGDVNLQYMQFQSAGSLPHRGIYLHGQANVVLTNLSISGGEQALTSTMVQYRNPLVLNQCNLNNNYTGVVTYGGQVIFRGSTFNSNTTAWMAYDMDGSSRIEECQFKFNDVAIDIMGQNDANLNITQSEIEDNIWGIKSFGQLYCRMNCSSVSNNTTGIYAGNYQWLIGGRSRNKFHNNQIAIRLEEVDNLFVFEGENDFSGSQMYITGTFSGIAMNYLYQNPMNSGYELNVKDNRLPVIAGNTRVHLRDWNDDPIYLYNHTPMPPFTALCEATQTVAFEDHVLQNWHSNILVTVSQGQLPLNDAVAQAKSLVTTNELQNLKTDLEAIAFFDNILSQIRNQAGQYQITAKDFVILEIALNKMLEAHNNAYRFELIPRIRAVDNVPKNIYLAAILTEIDARIAAELNNSTSDRLRFSLMLSKAQLYRTAEHYDYALETLQELKLVEDIYWSATAEYWDCICSAEKELIREVISAEHFESVRLECLLLGPMERRLQPIMVGDLVSVKNGGVEYNLFPNPVTSTVFLISNKLIGTAKIEILDLTGRKIQEISWPDRGDVIEIDLKTIKSGIYIARINSDNSSESVRFAKY